MSKSTEQEQNTAEATEVSTSTESKNVESPSLADELKTAEKEADSVVEVEKPKASGSSWFSSIPLPPNLTSQLSTFGSSFLQVTSKVSAAATNLVQKTLPQRPSTPTEIENNDKPNPVESTEQKTSEDNEQETGPSIDLTSIITDLGSTVMKSAQQLKQAVEETSLLGNFSKEHEKFLSEKRNQQRREEAAVPPWVGYVGEEEMKKQILELSKEKRNFLRAPPPGANFHFELSAMYPVALATLDVDENLKAMRFELVPKQINEESFWCNYFYRVSLIKQSTQLSALTQETGSTNNEGAQKQKNSRDRTTSDSHDKNSDVGSQDFVSEDYDASAVNMDEIRREIEELTETKKVTTDSQHKKSASMDETEWDKSLAEDLENVTAEELEAQINQMLASDNK